MREHANKGWLMLDPRTLTPQEFYKLQSETWTQGAESERDQIIKLIENLAAEQQKVIDFNPKRQDNKHREMVMAICEQISDLIKRTRK
jgi:hypothetical protein